MIFHNKCTINTIQVQSSLVDGLDSAHRSNLNRAQSKTIENFLRESVVSFVKNDVSYEGIAGTVVR